jgi:hypothetical protein
MKNLKLFSVFCLCISILSCNNSQTKEKVYKKKTQLKGDFVFTKKTIKNNSKNDRPTSDLKNDVEKTSATLKIHKKKEISKPNELAEKKEKETVNIFKQEPVKIPEKWSEAYSKDPKWTALYVETSDAFLTGWANEFITNPNTQIYREELLFAYRKRMEKIFFETPSFIEFCATELDKSDKFKSFLLDFQSNVQ